MRKTTTFYAVLLSLLLAAGVVRAAEAKYVIGKGDVLSVLVWGEESLSSDVTVRPDGVISLPGIGDVTAEGLTSGQLQARIAAKLGGLIHDPMVSVAVHTFPNNSIIVHGPGTSSTVLPLTGKTTILQVLSLIQPGNGADLEKAYIQRGGERIATGFDDLFRKGLTQRGDIEVLAGDRLFIPLRESRMVFVEGAVGKPSSLPHYDGMTVVEAIHLAGGFTKFADRNTTTITRSVQGNTMYIQARLHDFAAKGDLSQNVPLRGGDIIYVKASWF